VNRLAHVDGGSRGLPEMSFDVRNKDLWCAAILIAIGAVTMFIARNYPFGTTLRMGPGYFPIVLGGILILFGFYLAAAGWRGNPPAQPAPQPAEERERESWPLRGLILLPLAFILFGVLMTYAGFVPALLALIFVSALASP